MSSAVTSVARRAVRRQLEKFPTLAATYRQVQELLRRRPSGRHSTPYGFTLAGGDAQLGGFEEAETKLVLGLLSELDVFVDVGANVGFYTCLAGTRGAHTVSIEPSPGNLRWLYENLGANHIENGEVFPLGLASEPGLRKLYGAGTGASLVPGWAGEWEAFARCIPVTTLDIVIGARFPARRLLIKIDVEGAELEVLRGSRSILDRTSRPVWLVEICLTENQPAGVNPRFVDVFELFWGHGYEAHTADVSPRLVSPADVSRWVRNGNRDFGSHNYVFRIPSST